MSGATGVSIVHIGDRITYATDAACSLFGVSSSSELVGRSFIEFVSEEHHAPLTEQFERLRKHDADALGLTVTLAGSPEEDHEVIMLNSRIEWEGEDQILTQFIDVDDQMPSGLAATTFDATPVGVSIADATREDDPIVYVNDRFVDLTGYARDEILGQNCRFLQGPETDDTAVAEIRSALEAEELVSVELRNYRKDGTMFWNHLTIVPVSDETGDVYYYLGFQEDVSERKLFEREKALFEMEAKHVEQVIFITDAEGTIEYVNPAFERVTGYSAHEALGETPRLLKSGDQDEAFYRNLWETITAGEIWEETITNKRKSGERYRTTQKIVPVTTPNGEITHFVSIEEDITEAEFVEQVLDVMNRVLRHNVRNSVSVIDGYAALLEDEIDEPERRAAIRAIREHVEKLEKISTETRTIRELFRRRNQQHTLAVGAIEGFVEQRREQHPDATITLELNVDVDVEITNGSLLQLAIDEAIENAVVHNNSEHPNVTVTVDQSVSEDELDIRIADDGPGIPDEEWNVIESGQETALAHVSGIGLWLMYWTVTALGGAMERDANATGGSVVIYRIPLGEDEALAR